MVAHMLITYSENLYCSREIILIKEKEDLNLVKIALLF